MIALHLKRSSPTWFFDFGGFGFRVKGLRSRNSDKPNEVSGSKYFDWSAKAADFQFSTTRSTEHTQHCIRVKGLGLGVRDKGVGFSTHSWDKTSGFGIRVSGLGGFLKLDP